jgi:hypothetical protein
MPGQVAGGRLGHLTRHGAVRVAQHALGDRAQHEPADLRAPTSSHHDQIGGFLFCTGNDVLGRMAHLDLGPDRDRTSLRT